MHEHRRILPCLPMRTIIMNGSTTCYKPITHNGLKCKKQIRIANADLFRYGLVPMNYAALTVRLGLQSAHNKVQAVHALVYSRRCRALIASISLSMRTGAQ